MYIREATYYFNHWIQISATASKIVSARVLCSGFIITLLIWLKTSQSPESHASGA